MRIHIRAERFLRRLHTRILADRLEQIAAEHGPASFRSTAFLDTELKLGLALAALAEIECGLNDGDASASALERAEQIHTALRRFLPHADLEAAVRATLEARLERLGFKLARLSGRAVAA